MKNPAATDAHPTVTHGCQVMAVTPLSAQTFAIELQAPAGSTLRYRAGQYLQLELDLKRDGQRQSLSYSIANRFDPARPRHLQLFIQNTSPLSDTIVKHLRLLKENRQNTQVTLPLGRAYLQTDLEQPHVLIAAGSGISKIKCITEEILSQQPNAKVQVYWSNKHIEEFYLLDAFQQWQLGNPNLTFTPILETAHPDWTGASGFIYQVIKNRVEDLTDTQVYLCGSPQMVYGTLDHLQSKSLKEENCYSDVFEYAPREQKIAI